MYGPPASHQDIIRTIRSAPVRTTTIARGILKPEPPGSCGMVHRGDRGGDRPHATISLHQPRTTGARVGRVIGNSMQNQIPSCPGIKPLPRATPGRRCRPGTVRQYQATNNRIHGRTRVGLHLARQCGDSVPPFNDEPFAGTVRLSSDTGHQPLPPQPDPTAVSFPLHPIYRRATPANHNLTHWHA